MARSGGDALKIQENRGLDALEREQEWAWNRNASVQDDRLSALREHKFGGRDTSWISSLPSCPVFTPSLDEFRDPLAYISSIAPVASKYGICKIVSPVLPTAPAGKVLMKEKGCFKFNTRVQVMRLANWDSVDKVTFQTCTQRYTFQEFEKIANKFSSRKLSSAAVQPPAFVEAEFWKEMFSGKSVAIEYASDVDGSAFSADPSDPLGSSQWNLKGVSSLPSSTLRLLDTIIPGVTDPMLYIGMLFSMFAWHVEDHYLYSINYHHCGAPKTWYGVPGDACEMFENVVKEKIYDADMLLEHGRGAAYDLLIGKTTMFPPSVLRNNGVPVFRAVQVPGEFVITFPRSYHAGFSHGFNCGEAVNFAVADWFPFGAAACRRYSLLNRMPLLPHEELLWKEAAALGSPGGQKPGKHLTQVAFLQMMRLQHKVRWLLKQRGARLCISSCDPENVFCALCKHMCYVSFVTCHCRPKAICLNHAQELRECGCGQGRRIVLNKHIREMDTLAAKFQATVGDASPVIVDDGIGREADMPVLEQDLLASEDYQSYVSLAEFDDEYQVVGAIESVTSAKVVEECPLAPEATTSAPPKVKPGLAIRTMPAKKPLMTRKIVVDDALRSCFKQSTPELPKRATGNRPRCRELRTGSGDRAFLLSDIVSELKLTHSADEALREWQQLARDGGVELRCASVQDGDKHHTALTFRACQRLRKLLPEWEGLQLDKILSSHEGRKASSCELSATEAAKRRCGEADAVTSKRLKCGRSVSPVCPTAGGNHACERGKTRPEVTTGRTGCSDAEMSAAGAAAAAKELQVPRLRIKGPSLPSKVNEGGGGTAAAVRGSSKQGQVKASFSGHPVSV